MYILKHIAIFFSLTLLTLPATALTDETCLEIQNAWIAEAPPVSKVMVAYLSITNNTTEQIEIVRAESEVYSSIEFHETKHHNGIARMIRHSSLVIPAKSTATLRRGEKHLMLFNPRKHLKPGDSVSIKFTLSDNSTQSIDVNVRKAEF